MSLCVDIFYYDEDGRQIFLDAKSGKDLAGFESTRNTFYGSDFVKSLNLERLYSLRKGDLWIEGHELFDLKNEVGTLLQNLDKFVKDKDKKSYFKARLQNILNAVEKAKELNGGVVIW